jgi:excinuclease UvrABC nuclease subunit
MEQEMQRAVAAMNFEDAAKLRDAIKLLQINLQKVYLLFLSML